jgi:tRNA pseudouridine38/39 synthase
LKNVIDKKFSDKSEDTQLSEDVERKRDFDFSKHHRRHILLKFCYLGWDYAGYVVQDGGLETVELHLFRALKKVCLIESRETSNYNRCGRTDRGVSAFSQVISIDVRSRFPHKDQLTEDSINGEINYCNLLNKVLPKDIRAIAWMPLITPTFSARFDCVDRTYRYFFPRGDLNIELMQEASKNLLGVHDFRNLCKMDVQHGVTNYIRRLNSVEIKLLTKSETDDYDMFCLEINGTAFLWHMIRCIVGILFLIGEGKESIDIIKDLLDIEKNPKKPQYTLASEIPLNLFFCNFREDVLCEDDLPRITDMANKWIHDEEALRLVIVSLQEHWCRESVKSTMIQDMLKVLHDEYAEKFYDCPRIKKQATSLNLDNKKFRYIKLEHRQKAPSLDERMDFIIKKRKLNSNEEVQENFNEENGDE